MSAKGTTPGRGNFCILSDTPITRLIERLNADGIEIVSGPGKGISATGTIYSVYFKDPNGNLVEISNPV